jgi:hypothetical protein
MMHYYRFNLESPEGIDSIYEFMHEEKFSNETFDSFCMRAIKNMFYERIEKKKEKYIGRSELEGFEKKMSEFGFKKSDRKITGFAHWDPWMSDDPETQEIVSRIEEYNAEVGIM